MRLKTLAHDADQAGLRRRLRAVRPDSRARWGRMSAHQMICHAGDAYRMATGALAVAPMSGPLQRTVVKWVALYVPLRWPAGLPTSPELDQARGAGTRPEDFGADVARVEELLHLISSRPRRFEWRPHPVFGAMSEAAWLRWAWLHLDHHLRQFGV